MSERSADKDQISADAAWLAGFEDLSRRLRPGLLRFFRHKVGSATIAEELTQDLFLRLLRRADLFALDNIDGYVFEAAMNLVRDRARRDAVRGGGAPHLDVAGLDLVSDAPSAERIVEGRQRLEQLMSAIKQLPPRTRTVLILGRFEGLPYGEIAKRLRISVSAVEKHMVKAIASLQIED